MNQRVDLSGELAGPEPNLEQDPNINRGAEPAFEQDLAAMSNLVQSIAHHCQDNPQALLSLLRLLESLHRQIREEKFLAILPSNRQALYSLLRDIEREGGWPYIPGMSLRILLQYLDERAATEK